MAVVLIEGHKVHRHVALVWNEMRIEQCFAPVAAVKEIVGVGRVFGGGG